MENGVMFIVGVVIFSLYMFGYIMMVSKQNQIQKMESEKGKIQTRKMDEVDFDGHGNWGRVTKPKSKIKFGK